MVNSIRSSRQADPSGAAQQHAVQHALGRLTARERVELLLDPGSFVELGSLAGFPRADDDTGDEPDALGDGVIAGYGNVHGRRIFVFAKDRTVLGGTMSAVHAQKIAKIQNLALKSLSPIVGLYDTDGARLEEGMAALSGYAEQYRRSAEASGVVPQIAIIMGGCPGADALLPAMSDFLFMAGDDSTIFLSGPEVVEAVTHENVSAEELGGAAVHTSTSALADGVYENDVVALLQLRRFIDFLPEHNQDVRAWSSFDDPARTESALDTLVPLDPQSAYDIKELILRVVDEGDFFELQAAFAANLVVGFARVAGQTIGIVANQPMVLAGVLDCDAARKAARFVRCCDAFGISVVTFVDAAGFLPGTDQERGGIVRHSAQLLFAYAQATVPLVTVVVRKAFGAAWAVMAPRVLGADVNVAWPSAQLGLISAKGAAGLPRADARHLVAGDASESACERDHLSPLLAAARGDIDEVISPACTRLHVSQALGMLKRKRGQPRLRHRNIPL
jgi:propionyl-CoA carboxylase beta chain